MALFLESAKKTHATEARALGFVSGITTNPRLMREAGPDPMENLKELVEIFDGHVFYQLTAKTLEARIDEAWHAYDLRPDRVVVKLPASTENLAFLHRVPEIEVAITNVFSPIQAYAAAEAGAHYVMPYVTYATQHLGDGIDLVHQIAGLLADYPTEIIAANIQDLDQSLAALRAGANHLTLSLSLLRAMGNHPLSDQIVEEYTPKL